MRWSARRRDSAATGGGSYASGVGTGRCSCTGRLPGVCRRCGRLVYPSTGEEPTSRAISQAQKARRRIGAPENLALPEASNGKPKGMWYRTFDRLVWKARYKHLDALRAMAAAIGHPWND